MELEQVRNKVKAAAWQAIAQSGVNMTSLSSDDQNKLVDAITAQMLVVMDEVIGSDADDQLTRFADTGDEEQVLWKGRPLLSLVEYYVITSERIKVVRGLLGKDYENYELIRVQDIDFAQSVGERILDIGDIRIKGADPSHEEIVLRNIKNPHEVYELLRKAWLAARKKYGLIFREEM
ncbi:PH domain-containing protein [Bellilinea sp.]|uniref:PH domain-containing protein n=1 Tax=Bellilinea sp. TaxID=2838785 RepID=UPI002ADE4EC2|nr:PH domain-containing protein [Bellilinea sp.]